MKIKMMIVDDYSFFREGFKCVLEAGGDIEVICEASNGLDCLDKLKHISPDIILLDINMPEKWIRNY